MSRYIYKNTTDENKVIVNYGQVAPGKTIQTDEPLYIDGLEEIQKPESDTSENQPEGRPKAEVVGEEKKARKTIK